MSRDGRHIRHFRISVKRNILAQTAWQAPQVFCPTARRAPAGGTFVANLQRFPPVKRWTKESPIAATNPAHNAVRQAGVLLMRAQRVWRVNNGGPSVGQLQSRLDDLNKRLSRLESEHPESPKIESLKSTALGLSRDIDDIRCAEATAALSELLRR
jgi:hypothetical protein